MENYTKEPISNGNPVEQALIRKWCHEEHDGGGVMVWEYNLEGRYLDAVWFPDEPGGKIEEPGLQAPIRFPIKGREIVLCEAKIKLTPEQIGQALVYERFAQHAGAVVKETIVFSAVADNSMVRAAKELGLTTVVISDA